jgi:hypothetical protein
MKSAVKKMALKFLHIFRLHFYSEDGRCSVCKKSVKLTCLNCTHEANCYHDPTGENDPYDVYIVICPVCRQRERKMALTRPDGTTRCPYCKTINTIHGKLPAHARRASST